MHIRLATAHDIPETATIAASAFANDELHEWMYPHRTAYPAHFRAAFLRRYQPRFWSPDFFFYVAETDAGDEDWSGAAEVAGFAVWSRRGNSEVAKRRRKSQASWRATIEVALLRIEEWYTDTIKGDKSLDYSNSAQFRAAVSVDFEDVDEMWKLNSLATEPRFQHRGVGGMLITWGQEQARRENVCIGLTASVVGQGVYRKKGFRMYGVLPWPGFIDLPMMVWEPEGKEGAWGFYRDGKQKGVVQ